MKFTLPWQKHRNALPDPFPIIHFWIADTTSFTPYLRITRMGWGHPAWDAVLQRRASLARLKDRNFLPQRDRRYWDHEAREVSAIFGELLQPPTHFLELGYLLGDREHSFFREGFCFSYARHLTNDQVAIRVGRFVSSMLDRVQVPLKAGVLMDLRSEANQVFWLANILAAYKVARKKRDDEKIS